MNQLPGIIEVSFDIQTREATVTYDPAQVTTDEVSNAIAEANRKMGEDDNAASDADLLLTPDQEDDAPGT